MPRASVCIIGRRFGLLTVTSVDRIVRKNYTYYLCKCDCGGQRVVYRGNLTTGQCKSCGCQHHKPTHGHTTKNSRTYNSWSSMHARCRRPNEGSLCYKGISVCRRWTKFENFLADMGERPQGTTLDRLDSSKDYSPENCRWATPKQQCETRRLKGTLTPNLGRVITFKGESLSVSRWAKKLGLSQYTLYSRLKNKWPIERVLTSEKYP